MNFRLFFMLVLFFGLISQSCVKTEFDEPEFDFTDPDLTVTTTIAALKATHTIGTIEALTDGIISGIVVANDKSGNYYQTLVIADETGGIEIRIDKRSLFNVFPVGRKVFVKLAGLVMSDNNNLVQIGYMSNEDGVVPIPNEYVEDHIIGGSINHPVNTDTLTITQVKDGYMSTLITLKDVQFVEEDLGKTYADGTFKVTTNRTLEDCNGKLILLRTSGYASFANATIPEGKGTITVVLSKYRDDYQLYLRDTTDIKFTGERCGGSNPGDPKFDKDFEDGSLTSGGWTNKNVIGNDKWQAYAFSGDNFARITNYSNSVNNACDAWLISPQVDLSIFTNPSLSFRTACNYTGPDLEIYISKTYDGTSLPQVAQWTELAAPLSTGTWAWVPSGEVDLKQFANDKVYIAFRYQGTTSNGKTWEVDDIKIVNGSGSGTGETVFFDGFDANLNKWNAFSVKGTQVWVHEPNFGNPKGSAKMSGYTTLNNENEDWLISPAINLVGATDAVLTFETAKNYTGNVLELYYSDQYTGTGDPTIVNWTKATPSLSTGTFTWTPSGNMSLNAFLGKSVYFAFKYTSTSSASSTWELDNVKVVVIK